MTSAGMHPDQHVVTVDIVRALLRTQFPAWAALPIEAVDSQGTVNAIFRVGDGHTARFPLVGTDPASLAADLVAEQATLADFAAVSPVPAPRPVAVGAPGAGYPLPWSMQTWIDGVVADPVSTAGSIALAADLAQLITTLRSAPVGDRRFRGWGRGDALAPFDAYVRECLLRSRDIPGIDVEALSAVWNEVRELPKPDTFVMSHTDLIPGNLLLAGDRLAGVLDTGDFSPADPALDLVVAWHLFDAPARAVLRSAVGATDEEWQRGRAWALIQAVGLAWYYADTNPRMAALGRSTLARVATAGPGDPEPSRFLPNPAAEWRVSEENDWVRDP